MATANITVPDQLLPKLEEIAKADNRTTDDLAKEILERYVSARQAARQLEKLSEWGQQHAKRMGFRPSDVLPAIAETRREQHKR